MEPYVHGSESRAHLTGEFPQRAREGSMIDLEAFGGYNKEDISIATRCEGMTCAIGGDDGEASRVGDLVVPWALDVTRPLMANSDRQDGPLRELLAPPNRARRVLYWTFWAVVLEWYAESYRPTFFLSGQGPGIHPTPSGGFRGRTCISGHARSGARRSGWIRSEPLARVL